MRYNVVGFGSYEKCVNLQSVMPAGNFAAVNVNFLYVDFWNSKYVHKFIWPYKETTFALINPHVRKRSAIYQIYVQDWFVFNKNDEVILTAQCVQKWLT